MSEAAGPKYQHVMRVLMEEIDDGVLGPGERLPTHQELVRRFDVSRATVQRALRELSVESYEVSAGWRLPGAARDAQRFAAWLTGSGQVPPANVRLFLSPLPGTPRTDGLPEHAEATRENIERALFHDLPSRDGDLLWIHWAGHGFLDDRRELLLPYSEATGAHTSHLNLESALRWWGSSHVEPGRFRHQVAIVDACRVQRRPGARLNFGQVDYGMGAVAPDRRQFLLYAARPGEAAQNEADRRSGLFTRMLLRRLADLSVGQSVHELTEVTRRVQADFAELRASGQAWQEPTFEIDRGWNGSPIFGDHWAAPASPASGAPPWDQEAWNQLATLARGRGLPPHVYDAYRWAFDVCGCAAPLVDSLPAGGLTEIVRDLDLRQGRPGMPLALPFVRHLAAHAEDREWGARLGAAGPAGGGGRGEPGVGTGAGPADGR
ncbi:GntR family transcriptional regulator [Streptomyces sp. NPDC006739]|uniref:GntR family transcriptional regulator n=1 Tax=Streptomyces sp. NPDC006739 TaxID=3364763 RepID=UPI00367AC0C1